MLSGLNMRKTRLPPSAAYSLLIRRSSIQCDTARVLAVLKRATLWHLVAPVFSFFVP